MTRPFGEARRRYLAETWPAITLVGVAELSRPGLICELKGMAVVPAAR